MSYICITFILSLYIFPFLYKQSFDILGIQEGHPQWIGAWWMGLVIISIVLTLVSPLMTLFPSKLPTKKGERTDADVSNDLRLIVSIRKGDSFKER